MTAQLYERSLRRLPSDAMAALQWARQAEPHKTARSPLRIMINSVGAAESDGQVVCSDSGVAVYFERVGTQLQFSGPVRQAINAGPTPSPTASQANVAWPLCLTPSGGGRRRSSGLGALTGISKTIP